ncbi:MAG TPA: DUF72 domain-containing protein [Candidatus Tectomicrobia bacterium]|nr:DUF72 domain-containing protein [Candidatus Tectomicrobia bacterium]
MSEPRATSACTFIGTSGWSYKHWCGGIFYPEGIKTIDWLHYYSRHFNSVEINNTFYRLPARGVFEKWHATTPANFTFAVKANRFITHVKRLADPEEHVARFLENARSLGEKLHVILFQLPPYWTFDPGRLEGLFNFLSRQQLVPGVRTAVEVRHASWYCDACLDLLRRHHASLVLADWPRCIVEGPDTADFVFVRRHGPASLYASSYSDSSLHREAQRVRTWVAEGKSVYMYFNNDANGYAVKNALRLREILGEGPPAV